jgi:hypothetical protein
MIDGPAVYGFCGGDPVNRSDPMGTVVMFKDPKRTYTKNSSELPLGLREFLTLEEYQLLREMIDSDREFTFQDGPALVRMIKDPKVFTAWRRLLGLNVTEIKRGGAIRENELDKGEVARARRLLAADRLREIGSYRSADEDPIATEWQALGGGVSKEVADAGRVTVLRFIPHTNVFMSGVSGTYAAYKGDYEGAAIDATCILVSWIPGSEIDAGLKAGSYRGALSNVQLPLQSAVGAPNIAGPITPVGLPLAAQEFLPVAQQIMAASKAAYGDVPALQGMAKSVRPVVNLGQETTVPLSKVLDAAERWLGPGYKEVGKPGSGVFVSGDGLRGFRMAAGDLANPQGANHLHFVSYDASGKVVENLHLYMPGQL